MGRPSPGTDGLSTFDNRDTSAEHIDVGQRDVSVNIFNNESNMALRSGGIALYSALENPSHPFLLPSWPGAG